MVCICIALDEISGVMLKGVFEFSYRFKAWRGLQLFECLIVIYRAIKKFGMESQKSGGMF
jgi:hypothetical protein